MISTFHHYHFFHSEEMVESEQSRSILYFAYGSNMNEKRMKHRLPAITSISFGILPGYKLQFHSYSSNLNSLKGFCTIEPCKTSTVEGVLYSLPFEILEVLDSYEGVPCSYCREEIQVYQNGKTVQAITYIAQQCSVKLMPSTDYLFHVLQNPFFSRDYKFALSRTITLEENIDKIPLFIHKKDHFDKIFEYMRDISFSESNFTLMGTTFVGKICFATKVQAEDLEQIFGLKRYLYLSHTANLSKIEVENAMQDFMITNKKQEFFFASWTLE